VAQIENIRGSLRNYSIQIQVAHFVDTGGSKREY